MKPESKHPAKKDKTVKHQEEKLTEEMKEKQEDEFLSQIRLESLVWATYINYAVLAFSILFIHGMAFFDVMVFNMFTILIFFLVRYNWRLYQTKNALAHEE